MAVHVTYVDDRLYHPLYHKYGDSEPEAAYVYLDCEARRLWADVGPYGGGVTMKQSHGHIRTWLASYALTWKEINRMLYDIQPHAEKLCDAHSSDWDGHNWIAQYSGASGVWEDIETIVCEMTSPDLDGGPWDAADWLNCITIRTEDEDGNDVVEIEGYGTIRAETTDEQISAMAKRIEAEANEERISVPDADDYLLEIRNDLARQ